MGGWRAELLWSLSGGSCSVPRLLSKRKCLTESLRHSKDVCGAIVAASHEYSIAHVCQTLVYIVTENQLSINGERCSIMSESGWKLPPPPTTTIKTIRGQSMCFHPQDGNCTQMAQTLWRSPIQSQIINIKLAGKKSKCQSAQQSSGRWLLPLFYIQFCSPCALSLVSNTGSLTSYVLTEEINC